MMFKPSHSPPPSPSSFNAGLVLLHWFYPKRCLSCNTDLNYNDLQEICESCLHSLQPLDSQSPPVYAYGRFEGVLRKLILELKYRQKERLSKTLARLLFQVWDRFPRLQEMEMIVPVPLHPARLRERGYNQSSLLARDLNKILRQESYGIPVTEGVLVRNKNSIPQAQLSRADRLRNMESAFAVRNPNWILNKNILLIDDVYTTGTTLEACTLTLLRAKAKKVLSLTVALT